MGEGFDVRMEISAVLSPWQRAVEFGHADLAFP
jgi:hypothetical protein